MRVVGFLVVLVWAGCLPASPVFGQVNPLRVEDVVATHSFSEFTPVIFSPDGKRLVYAAKDDSKKGGDLVDRYSRTGVFLSGVGADLFSVQVATGELLNITGGTRNNWAPAWSPDGRYLAFLSDRDGGGQAKLWIWEVASGKMRKASDVIVRANEIQWLLNSKEVLVTVLPENLTPVQFAERATGLVVRNDSVKPMDNLAGPTVVLYGSKSNGRQGPSKPVSAWNLDIGLRDLVLVDVNNGTARPLDRGNRIAAYALSPDGTYVALTMSTRFEKPGSQQILFDLKILSIGNGKSQVVASDIRLRFDGSTFSWAPDSSRLVYQTGGTEASGDCYLLSLKDSSSRNISNLHSRPGHGAPPPVWGPEGHRVYFLHKDAIWKASEDRETATLLAKIPGHRLIEIVARQGVAFSPDGDRSFVVFTYDNDLKQSGFYSVNQKTGASAKLIQESQWYFAVGQERNVSASPDGKFLAFFSEDAQHSQELWLASPDFSDAHQLTHINPQLEKYQMGAPRLIGWQTLNGEQLRGALLMPAGYIEGRSYPLIVCVYGGASLSSNLVQFGLGCGAMNMQLFATRGYAVLLPDAPQHLGTPMVDLADTVLPGVNKVIEMGIADPDRLGVMGHSYGGYSVLSLIVQTKRFKAAMAADGFGDITASYGQMNKDGSAFGQSVAESGQGLMGGTPWQFRERYIENSPVFYLDRVETPLLIVHGAADTTVLSFLSDETFVGLRRLGKEVVYAKYEGEGHSPLYWSYANQLDYSSRVIAWFDDHLKKPEIREPDKPVNIHPS
jgi:dipeptidyl aminopeptidase/acylaminoacyl peptidase